MLLELNGTRFYEENGYWHKIEAWKVNITPERPHGIRYCLTLHDHYNQRIFGIDIAHAIPGFGRHRYTTRIVTYDHIHESNNDKVTPYHFKNAAQLLEYFYYQVNIILKEIV